MGGIKPPTKPCPFKIGDKIVAVGNYEDEQLGDYAYTGVQTVLAIVDVRHLAGTSGWWLKTDHKDKVDAAWFRLALSGTGNVAAEHSNVPMTQNSLQEASPSQSHEPLAPTAETSTDKLAKRVKPIYDATPPSGPTAEHKHKFVDEVCTKCGYKKRHYYAASPTPPAATDDEVMAILDGMVGGLSLGNEVRAVQAVALAALEARYAAKDAARFERAIGEDKSPHYIEGKYTGEEDPTSSNPNPHFNTGWNYHGKVARSIYYGETK